MRNQRSTKLWIWRVFREVTKFLLTQQHSTKLLLKQRARSLSLQSQLFKKVRNTDLSRLEACLRYKIVAKVRKVLGLYGEQPPSSNAISITKYIVWALAGEHELGAYKTATFDSYSDFCIPEGLKCNNPHCLSESTKIYWCYVCYMLLKYYLIAA